MKSKTPDTQTGTPTVPIESDGNGESEKPSPAVQNPDELLALPSGQSAGGAPDPGNSDVAESDLDEEGAAMIEAVEDRDLPDDQRNLARRFTGRLNNEIDHFEREQEALGGPHHTDGVRRSGWAPWARFFKVGSYVLMSADAGSWYVCGTRALVHAPGLVLAALAMLLALAGKSCGSFLATIRLTDPGSARQTVEAHIQAARRSIIPLLAAGLLAILTFFAPSGVAPWVIAVGWIPLVALNVLLAFLAGLSASLADLLSRPKRYDEFDDEIRRRRRTRGRLQRYLTVIFVVGLSVSITFAGMADACGVFVDETDSLNAVDRDNAVAFVLDTVPHYLATTGCTWVVAGKFAGDGRFERRVWLRAPRRPRSMDCQKAEPEHLAGHVSVFEYARGVAGYLKDKVVQRCEGEQAAELRQYEDDRTTFLNRLTAALAVTPRRSFTRLTDFMKGVVDSGLRAVVAISDGIDNPPASPRGLVVPAGTDVILILVRPNPRYATAADVLARAREWASLPRVHVVTTGELRPGLWDDLGKK